MRSSLGLIFFVAGLTLQAQGYDPSNGNLASASSYDATGDGGYVDDGQLIQTAEPPPPLPEYDQPEMPGDDYYWTPGYWAWSPSGYYWVPGAWVLAPYVGAVWTPPYWDFSVGYYRWHPGYWGSHVGFYGGIDYGFGYTGRGYYGAYWNSGHLTYNRAVTRVNVNVHNVYNYSVPRGPVSRVSYNGGRGGITARPTPQERAVVRDRRMPAVAAQAQHAREAQNNRAQFAQGGRLRQNATTASPQLNTNYRAPAAQAPTAAHAPARSAPVMRPTPQAAPQQQQRREPQLNNHLELQRPAPQAAPAPQPAPQQRHDARPENHPAPVARPAPQVQQQQQQRPAAPPRMREPQPQHAPQPQAAPPAPQASHQEVPHQDRGEGRGEHERK